MHVVSHPEANQELEAAAMWYEQRESGLGDVSLDEFERNLRRIETEPNRWRKIRGKSEAKLQQFSLRNCLQPERRHNLHKSRLAPVPTSFLLVSPAISKMKKNHYQFL
jgi:hypothetical protein